MSAAGGAVTLQSHNAGARSTAFPTALSKADAPGYPCRRPLAGGLRGASRPGNAP